MPEIRAQGLRRPLLPHSLPSSLPASTWGNTTATKFKKLRSCPPSSVPLFLDVRFYSPALAAQPKRHPDKPGSRGTWLWCRWVSGSTAPRAGAAPSRCSSADSCPADRLWLAPKTRSTSSAKVAGAGAPRNTAPRGSISSPAGRSECQQARSTAHPSAPPPPLPAHPVLRGAGAAPARLGPSPGGVVGRRGGQQRGGAPGLRTGRAPLPRR